RQERIHSLCANSFAFRSSIVRRMKPALLDTHLPASLFSGVVAVERWLHARGSETPHLLSRRTPETGHERRRACPACIPRSTAALHSSDGGASLFSSCQIHHSYGGLCG